jgi:hypothetical protein
MKLNTAQVARTESQLQAQALPENHPLVPELNRLFGDHTYFLNRSGLNIVERAGEAPELSASDVGGDTGVVINIANWTDSSLPKLKAHEPELTDYTVALLTDGG